MGTSRKNTRNKVHGKNCSVRPKRIRFKGDRLGWVAIKNVKSINLSNISTKGEEVSFKDNNNPLLVP